MGPAHLLQDRYEARALLSEAEWNVIAKNNLPAQYKPRKDMVVTDGQKLTLGDVTVIAVYHTWPRSGTVSLIASPIMDGDQKHVASMFGGRGFRWAGATHGVQYFPTVLEGITKWGSIGEALQDDTEGAGADVFLSNMMVGQDLGQAECAEVPAAEGPAPICQRIAVARYQTILAECMDAQLAWRTSN